MFFKRLSRGSRSNSYVDDYDSPGSKTDAKYDQTYDNSSSARPQSSGRRQSVSAYNKDISISDPVNITVPDTKDANMYPRSAAQQDGYGQRPMTNGMGHSAMPLDTAPLSGKIETAPDLLTRAFNEAVRPYTDKIEQLENQLADLQAWVEQLEQQRAEVHSWIDKRGLRPDVPPSIAKSMDAQPDAASTLNAQLDRKITIVNFDLHRLQDDLNDSISSAHFASAMCKFLPDITRLSSLTTGPRYAFDLILKLGGNLNSHGGLDTGDAEDLAARRDFYGRLDGAMVEVVRRRFQEGEDWPVQREIKRIEKTAAYLRNFGVEPYFPMTLDLMTRGMGGHVNGNGIGSGQGTPPRYQ